MSRRRVIPLLLLPLALAGCSQVAALAPVGGDDVAMVRFAAIDVLVAQGVPILAAPVCTLAATAITCTGTTTEGEQISVDSGSADDASILVKVGDRTLYSGSLDELLAEFMRPAS
jgi:hypothetical protein